MLIPIIDIRETAIDTDSSEFAGYFLEEADLLSELRVLLRSTVFEKTINLSFIVIAPDFNFNCGFKSIDDNLPGLANVVSANSHDAVTVRSISSFTQLFELSDSSDIFLMPVPRDLYDYLQHLFVHIVLIRDSDCTLTTKAFIHEVNRNRFTFECTQSDYLAAYKVHLNKESAKLAYVRGSSPAEFIDDRMVLGGADLHIHTTASDSSDSPDKVCSRVAEARLKTFAITDHDNTEAVDCICDCLREHALNEKENDFSTPVYIPGVEISVQEERELHLLAYFPFGGHERLQSFLVQQQQAREKRNEDMITTLQSLGYSISLDELNASGDYSVGRMQMALLLKARGYVKTTAQAFAELLGFGCPGYIERPRPSLSEALCQIRLAGGVPVLAHPALYGWCRPRNSNETYDNLIQRFSTYKSWGLIGIEAFHGEAEKQQQHLLSKIALELQMLRTGGSDDHGRNKAHTNLYQGDVSFF